MRYPSHAQARFERTAARDAELAALHKARVRYVNGRHRAVCPCLWSGEWRSTRAEAERDAADHRTA